LNALQNGSVFLFALTKLFFHSFAFGNIHETAQGCALPLIFNGSDGFERPHDSIILADESIFVGFKTFLFQTFDSRVTDLFFVLRMDMFKGVLTDQFDSIIAGYLLV